MPALSILVVSYNTRELTLACLNSVYAQARSDDFEIIVVDNQSADGSADAIAEAFPQIRLIRSSENLGFARANNCAAGHAHGDHLLLLNPDTEILDHGVDRLLDFAKTNPTAGIWGGKTVFADGSLNPSSCWGRITNWSIFCKATGLSNLLPANAMFNPEGYGSWQRNTVRPVDIVSGCFLLIGNALWNALGGFDESFFMYGEDADLCLRAARTGARPLFTPDATIIHHGSASERVRPDKLARLFAGRVHAMRIHFSPLRFAIGTALVQLLVLTRLAASWAMSVLSPSERWLESRRVWQTMWAGRRNWLQNANL